MHYLDRSVSLHAESNQWVFQIEPYRPKTCHFAEKLETKQNALSRSCPAKIIFVQEVSSEKTKYLFVFNFWLHVLPSDTCDTPWDTSALWPAKDSSLSSLPSIGESLQTETVLNAVDRPSSPLSNGERGTINHRRVNRFGSCCLCVLMLGLKISLFGFVF